VGPLVLAAERAAAELANDGISVTVVNARFVKPLDTRLLLDLATSHQAIVTVEENAAAGGFGSAVLELFAANGVTLPITTLGVPDRIFDHASQQRLREIAGVDITGIATAARKLLARVQDSQVHPVSATTR
jgi:1-deoxy-D-xylulose-5-phosphate synthase